MDRKDNFWKPDRPFMLAMENPLEPTADVGASSYRIQTVQRSFEVAFKILLSHVTQPLVPTTSILGNILPPTEEMKQRAVGQRQLCAKPAAGNNVASALSAPRGSPNNKNRRDSGNNYGRPQKRQRR